MANTRKPGPQNTLPPPGVCSANSPGPTGKNDRADLSVTALKGDAPWPTGVNSHGPPQLLCDAPKLTSATNTGNASSRPLPRNAPSANQNRATASPAQAAPVANPSNQDVSQPTVSGTVPVGVGVPSVARIPVPGTNGLYVELSPRNFKGKSTSTLFIQDITGKKVLRLDYGYNVKSGSIDFHWNQKGTFADFGIQDHTTVGSAGEALYKSAKYLKWGGRVLLVVGAALDIYSIVVARKKVRQVLRVASGWAGADAGCVLVGGEGAGGGTVVEPGGGTAVGAILGCAVGGVAGYIGASWAAGEAYDLVEETFFEPLPIVQGVP